MSGVSRRPLWAFEVVRALKTAVLAAVVFMSSGGCFRIFRRIHNVIAATFPKQAEFRGSSRQPNPHDTNLAAAPLDWSRRHAPPRSAPPAAAQRLNQLLASWLAAIVSGGPERHDRRAPVFIKCNEARKAPEAH
jgi:hypothetical protein